jgi:glyoxalase family protein
MRTSAIAGFHHVTALCGDPQRNLDFYSGVLGLRLVKRTVNFDDPSTYHLYYGDGRGTPGTILTFFAWPGARHGHFGVACSDGLAFLLGRQAARTRSRGSRAGRTPRCKGHRFC